MSNKPMEAIMGNVYCKNDYLERVRFAASKISSGQPTTRQFNTCFEMNDGDVVAVALIRRITRRPNTTLASNIWNYIDETFARECAEKYRQIPDTKLPALAARIRDEATCMKREATLRAVDRRQ